MLSTRGIFDHIDKILHRKEDIDHCQLFEIVSNGHELQGHDLSSIID